MGLKQQARLLRRIETLAAVETDEDVSVVAFEFYRTRFIPLTSTERSQRLRARERNAERPPDATPRVPPDATPAVPESATPGVPQSATPRVPSPPAPPAVSSSLRGFEQFWSNYPKQVGKGKAEESWKKLKCSEIQDKILEAIEKQREYITRDGGQFVPNPATWLNQKRWQDTPPNGNGTVSLARRLWDEAARDERGER